MVVLGACLAGCAREVTTQRSLDLEEARTSGGLFLEEEDPVRLVELAAALDRLDVGPRGRPVPAPERLPVAFPEGPADDARALEGPPAPVIPSDADVLAMGGVPFALPDPETTLAALAFGQLASEPPADPVAAAGRAIAMGPLPPDAVALVDLPRISEVELADLVAALALEIESVFGYAPAPRTMETALPAVPDGISDVQTFVREPVGDGAVRVLRHGRRRFASQPAKLWLQGLQVDEAGTTTVNPDLVALPPVVEAFLARTEEFRAGLTVLELEKRIIQLSYVDAETALAMLQGMGVITHPKPEDVPREVEFDRLPMVVKIPDPEAASVGLVGEVGTSRGEFGVSLIPSAASQLAPQTLSGPTTQLMVMFHPAHPGQFSRIRALIDDYIDRPARQIYVEGMVLEISDAGLKDLGIEWELNEGPVSFNFGSQNADGLDDTVNVELGDLDFWRVFTRDFEWKWSVKLRALLRDEKAEVLSRPSVLTLDNRQSTIRVGRDIPVATSTEGTTGNSNRVSFNFKYLPTGILLNIRPRINESGTEVSMLIDTVVSAVVPGADLVIRSVEGDELASAPTVSTRRVQTYARIRNNTPFIIGGLVSQEDSTAIDKVPILGDLPLIGGLFRAENRRREKREVIIVLTPFVLPEVGSNPMALPKDEDLFDSVGPTLFRESYRVREEDVFDLGFLRDNARLEAYADLAREAVRRNYRLATREPYATFVDGGLPGEDVLITRMLYDMVRRTGLGESVDPERAMLFEGERPGGYEVRLLSDAMGRVAGGLDYEAFFDRLEDKAMVVSWVWDAGPMDDGTLRQDPIPVLSIVDCPDRERWGELLWNLNQPLPDGRSRRSIVLADVEDMRRLQRAIAIKQIVRSNGGEDLLSLASYDVGRVLVIPTMRESAVHVVDPEVARYFFHSEHYYGATIDAIEDAMRAMEVELRTP